ncbi:hypothetical protein J6590_032780 [Homalodisca vitripennis]|nr:hypothetical protein J6590_032780 [Homalodisca vitripennis]
MCVNVSTRAYLLNSSNFLTFDIEYETAAAAARRVVSWTVSHRHGVLPEVLMGLAIPQIDRHHAVSRHAWPTTPTINYPVSSGSAGNHRV